MTTIAGYTLALGTGVIRRPRLADTITIVMVKRRSNSQRFVQLRWKIIVGMAQMRQFLNVA
jgi:hypothetical protein